MKRNKPIADASENQTEKLAAESGLAIIVVDEKGSVSKSNNNSICERLYSSDEFAPRCAQDCGRAFQRATDAGTAVGYQCHAGLDCVATPLKTANKLVAIVGRTFTRAENYRLATTRASNGDWQQFPADEFFENVLISGSAKDLETVAKRLEDLGDRVLPAPSASAGGFQDSQKNKEPQITDEQPAADQKPLTKLIEEFHEQNTQPPAEDSVKKKGGDAQEVAAWRSLFGALFDLSYHEACLSIIKFLSGRYSLQSLAWLERRENRFESILASGSLAGRQFKINLPANDKLLFDALESELALELRERARWSGETKDVQTIALFPVSVGGEIQSALVVADDLLDTDLKRHISRFCRTVAAELEILRLREEVKRRERLSEAVEKFNASLRNLDTEDFWATLTRVSAELMNAERSSLLVFDEKNNSLTVKAAVGATADRIKNQSKKIGERVSRLVLQNKKPIVVGDISKVGLPAAPADWKYKSKSFISYPFTIGDRRVGVLNVTEKSDGEAYNESDLEVLNIIAPQVAILIDRAALKNDSVTDSLTGLLNRRYLEERLAEEINRSNRYGYPMSFMMIDVDNFKSYNDTFGHIEGDSVLRLVAKCFRETLRAADIAARYGGEEFSILLPQTNSVEAETIAERLREHIAVTEFPNRTLTVSIGIASCCLDLNSVPELIAAADNALYKAKRKGKNNVQVYENLRNNHAAESPRTQSNLK
ncbi:MAG TPA: diguanylate cyclase [Pyrinomonadaceae bacterium]|jgi:diguanylate cyclase (GGDEF)-like protein